MKKLFSCFLLLGVGLLPFFGTITEASNLTVQIPTDLWEKNDDIYIEAKGSSANAVVGNEKTLYSTLNMRLSLEMVTKKLWKKPSGH